MTEVKFYESIEDKLLKFAVTISKTQNKYIFCHRFQFVDFSKSK